MLESGWTTRVEYRDRWRGGWRHSDMGTGWTGWTELTEQIEAGHIHDYESDVSFVSHKKTDRLPPSRSSSVCMVWSHLCPGLASSLCGTYLGERDQLPLVRSRRSAPRLYRLFYISSANAAAAAAGKYPESLIFQSSPHSQHASLFLSLSRTIHP